MTTETPSVTTNATSADGPVAIVVSRADEASEHIGDQLLEVAEWERTSDERRAEADGGGAVHRRPNFELRTFEERHLDMADVATAFDESPRLVVFASRHSGDTGPLLTAHHTGNFGPAEYGGEEGNFARAAPNALQATLSSFREHAPDGYEVGMECTHHGPTDVGAPSLFVEVGSGPDEWADPDAARAAARAILDLADVPADKPDENGARRQLVGFGGGHYAPRFERIVRETDWSVGHVAADWCLDELGDPTASTAILEQAFEASASQYALLEADRPELADAIDSCGARVVGETWVRETREVPLPLVDRLEAALEPIDEGLRFGDPARERAASPEEVAIGEVPGSLRDALNAVDREATLSAVAEHALGYETENAGSRFAGGVALADPAAETDLLDSLEEVLVTDYDKVERTDEAFVVRRTEFDPALAREAGVEPGPDFGRLADGEPVTVDGKRVAPADVTVEREERLPATVISN